MNFFGEIPNSMMDGVYFGFGFQEKEGLLAWVTYIFFKKLKFYLKIVDITKFQILNR